MTESLKEPLIFTFMKVEPKSSLYVQRAFIGFFHKTSVILAKKSIKKRIK